MARYIALAKVTREGAISLKETPQRFSKGREYLEQIGVKILEFYATLGPYDYVAILEGPEDIRAVFKSAAFTGTLGSASWITLPALPMEDFINIIKEIP